MAGVSVISNRVLIAHRRTIPNRFLNTSLHLQLVQCCKSAVSNVQRFFPRQDRWYPLELANYGRILIANTAVLACLVASTDEYQNMENEANTVG